MAEAQTHSTVDELSEQIATLRADLAKLARTAAAGIGEGVDMAGDQVAESAADVRAYTVGVVTAHPFAAIGVAAGLGLLLGYFVRR